jgi:hypothetical protein
MKRTGIPRQENRHPVNVFPDLSVDEGLKCGSRGAISTSRRTRSWPIHTPNVSLGDGGAHKGPWIPPYDRQRLRHI